MRLAPWLRFGEHGDVVTSPSLARPARKSRRRRRGPPRASSGCSSMLESGDMNARRACSSTSSFGVVADSWGLAGHFRTTPSHTVVCSARSDAPEFFKMHSCFDCHQDVRPAMPVAEHVRSSATSSSFGEHSDRQSAPWRSPQPRSSSGSGGLPNAWKRSHPPISTLPSCGCSNAFHGRCALPSSFSSLQRKSFRSSSIG